MNPDTNKFEELDYAEIENGITERLKKNTSVLKALLRPDGTPVPKHWSIFQVGEMVVIKDYTFKVAYIGESNILFEPVSPATKLCEELGK